MTLMRDNNRCDYVRDLFFTKDREKFAVCAQLAQSETDTDLRSHSASDNLVTLDTNK